MHSLGNDFVVLDRITQHFTITPKLMSHLGDRHLGIGCDQILLIDPPISPNMDFSYRIFNADGKEVEQCGNGARCIGRYLLDKGLTSKTLISVDSLGGPIQIDVQEPDHIEAYLGHPQFPPKAKGFKIQNLKETRPARYKIPIFKAEKEISLISLGNPHCILSVPNIKDAKVTTIGKSLQSSPFFPEGVNVSFVQLLARNHIKLRIYERGVGETQACGTAACAAVIAGIMGKELNSNVQVEMPGGRLSVSWTKENGVRVSGNTYYVFQGSFLIQQPEEND